MDQLYTPLEGYVLVLVYDRRPQAAERDRGRYGDIFYDPSRHDLK